MNASSLLSLGLGRCQPTSIYKYARKIGDEQEVCLWHIAALAALHHFGSDWRTLDAVLGLRLGNLSAVRAINCTNSDDMS